MYAKFLLSAIIYAEVIAKNSFSTGKPLVPGLKLLKACLHGGWRPQVREVTRFGWVTRLST